MKQSFLIRLLPAACAVLVAPLAFAQGAPAAPGFRGGVRAAAPQDPSPAPVARSESADRVQIGLAEVMAMLEEEQMSAETQAQALAKLTEVMERLKRDRAAGQTPAPVARGGSVGVRGGVARSAPEPTPAPAPAQMPRIAGRVLGGVRQGDDPVVYRARVVDPAGKPEQMEAVGVPRPPKAPKAPKAPKPPKAPKVPKAADEPAASDNPMMRLHELHAKATEEAAKAHEGAVRAMRSALSRQVETTKAHEEALEVHHEALREKVQATRKLTGAKAEAKDKAGEQGAFERLLRRTAGHDDEAAKEKAHTEAARSRDAKVLVERARATQPAPKAEPRRRVVREEEGDDDEAEIRATIDAMRAELREIRALLKQIGSSGQGQAEGRWESHAEGHGATGQWRELEAKKDEESARASRSAK